MLKHKVIYENNAWCVEIAPGKILKFSIMHKGWATPKQLHVHVRQDRIFKSLPIDVKESILKHYFEYHGKANERRAQRNI